MGPGSGGGAKEIIEVVGINIFGKGVVGSEPFGRKLDKLVTNFGKSYHN